MPLNSQPGSIGIALAREQVRRGNSESVARTSPRIDRCVSGAGNRAAGNRAKSAPKQPSRPALLISAGEFPTRPHHPLSLRHLMLAGSENEAPAPNTGPVRGKLLARPAGRHVGSHLQSSSAAVNGDNTAEKKVAADIHTRKSEAKPSEIGSMISSALYGRDHQVRSQPADARKPTGFTTAWPFALPTFLPPDRPPTRSSTRPSIHAPAPARPPQLSPVYTHGIVQVSALNSLPPDRSLKTFARFQSREPLRWACESAPAAGLADFCAGAWHATWLVTQHVTQHATRYANAAWRLDMRRGL